jgi:hypothetical protein
LISYLGFRENNDEFYNSIDIIYHDFDDVHYQYDRKLSYTDSELEQLKIFILKLYDSFKSDKVMLEKISLLIHNNNYESDVKKLEVSKFVTQNCKKFIITLSTIIDIIKKYVDQYKSLPTLTSSTSSTTSISTSTTITDTDKSAFIKLVEDEYFYVRFNPNNIFIKRGKIKLLDSVEKELLIRCLNEVLEVTDKDQIINFINDSSYTIDLSKQLTPNQISFIIYKKNKQAIIKKIPDIHIIYEFIKFLYENYNELFIDNKIYENLTLFYYQ